MQLLIVLAVICLVFRIFDLSIINRQFLQQQGNERVLRIMNVPTTRGMIVDRNHFPLAISTQVFSIWVNPEDFNIDKKALKALGQILKLKPQKMAKLILEYKNKHKEFLYLKRNLSPEVAQQIKSLHIPGIYMQNSTQRYYPEGETTAHIIGFTNIDDKGQEGLELGYNEWLAGSAGKKWVTKDRLGRVIDEGALLQSQSPGRDLVLSVDRRLQYLAYRELLEGIHANEAEAGSVVILDVKTGEVLALVNYPSFNPNNRAEEKPEYFRNRAITDVFEPGSTIKAFSIANALGSGQFKPDTLVDTYPGWIRVQRNVVRDEHQNGVLTLTQILQKSSNVGMTKITLSLPAQKLWDLLHKVGFTENTGIGFPGEQMGTMMDIPPNNSFMLATLGFGYGLSVTPLQLARAYAVLAHDGIKLPLSLLRVDEPPKGERVMSAQVTKEVLTLLETVLKKGGTAGGANVPGYRVAGKTGTSKLAKANGYEKNRYHSSFVGIAPASQPRFVVAVVIHDPRGKHYHGGSVSGPIFEKIMEGVLRTYAIPPDA